MHRQKTGARGEYHQLQNLRVQESVPLAEKFRQLKSLTVDLAYYDPERQARSSQLKYTVNLEHAKSVFRFFCQNNECVRGDFDLSQAVADAVAAHRTSVSGEMCCEGWRNKATIDSVRCHNVLRYKLTLKY